MFTLTRFWTVHVINYCNALKIILFSISNISDENDCDECDEALHELERIDDEADDLDIMFVKIKDPRYAKKYGITEHPSLVYFRKKFPSIYRGKKSFTKKILFLNFKSFDMFTFLKIYFLTISLNLVLVFIVINQKYFL